MIRFAFELLGLAALVGCGLAAYSGVTYDGTHYRPTYTEGRGVEMRETKVGK